MPVKKRSAKRRTSNVSAEAVARWRKVGPDALGPSYVADDVLADLLGLDGALLAVPADQMAALRAELERGEHRAD